MDRSENPQHRLVVHELKGAWTSSNRDVAFALLDSFVKTQVTVNFYSQQYTDKFPALVW